MLPRGVRVFSCPGILESSVYASSSASAQRHIDDVGFILHRILLVFQKNTMRSARGEFITPLTRLSYPAFEVVVTKNVPTTQEDVMTIDYAAMTKDELCEELEGLLEELAEAQMRVAEIEEDSKTVQDELASR
jgi:hypothetical protein